MDTFTMLSINWSGDLDEPDFLARLYPLGKLPSNDYRFKTAYDDVRQHRVNNDDWSNDYVFLDDRFNLLWGTDENLLKFLEMTLHPLVLRGSSEEEVAERVEIYNDLLKDDGYELEPRTLGRQVIYKAKTIPHPVSGKALKKPQPIPLTAPVTAVNLIESDTAPRDSEQIRSISPAVSVPLTAVESGHTMSPSDTRRVFIVHGHDEATKHDVALFLHRLTGKDPVILHEQPNLGMHVVTKLEKAAATANFAVVLLTPDDLGKAKADKDLQSRARQNVVFEMGFFMAKLGRERVVILYTDGVEVPGDTGGMLYIKYGSFADWKNKLAGELKACNIHIDLDVLTK